MEWKHDSEREYLVKSAYNILQNNIEGEKMSVFKML